MQKNKGRICLACGQKHNGKLCPLIREKLNKYNHFNKKNYLIGNIHLMCIKKHCDFFQILLEIVELNEVTYNSFSHSVRILPIEQFIEYFAISLNCHAHAFIKERQKTVEEYAQIIEVCGSPEIILHDNFDDTSSRIDIPVTIDEYIDFNTVRDFGIYESTGYQYMLSRIKTDKNELLYNLYLHLSPFIRNDDLSLYQESISQSLGKRCIDYFANMNEVQPKDFLLATDYTGELKNIFEQTLDMYWTDDELITVLPYKNSNFEIWIEKLTKITVAHFLEWHKYDENGNLRYYSKCSQTEIVITINSDNASLYVRDRDDGLGTKYYNDNDDVGIQKIVKLCKIIDEHIKMKESNNFIINLDKKMLVFSSVMLVSYSMICHNHYIKPYRGIVQLLTNENTQIEYEIYVGYCHTCDKYYCFNDDYQQMIKHGVPLCAVSNETERKKNIDNKFGSFRYKSQSVLNAMGYTVGVATNLTVHERQRILKSALDSHLFEEHDLISFLNWLIQTRKTQPKYSKTIEKWAEDLEFVKSYNKDSRDKVAVKGILLRKNL